MLEIIHVNPQGRSMKLIFTLNYVTDLTIIFNSGGVFTFGFIMLLGFSFMNFFFQENEPLRPTA